MSNIYAKFLAEHADTQIDSVQSYIIEDQKVWLKKAAQRHSTWIYYPLQWISKLLGLSMLAPVPNKGGEDAIACEVKRIQSLAKLGVHVPEILAFQDNAVLLKDAARQGQSIQQLERALRVQKDSSSRLALLEKAILSLEYIHAQKNYLSEAFARNILVDDQHNFSYIDFETDPGLVHSLQDCQTRDWLCFIFSTSHRCEVHELNSAADLFEQSLSKHPQIFADICRVGRKFTWLLNIKPEKVGNDGKRLKKCITLLKLLNERTQTT